MPGPELFVSVVTLPQGLPPYTIHQYLYGYFPQCPLDARRPFLFQSRGDRAFMVSRIPPACPHRVVTIEAGRSYAVEGELVPVLKKARGYDVRSKVIPLTGNLERRDWFTAVCGRHGASVGTCLWFNRNKRQFRHSNGHLITLCPGQVKAMVYVTDADGFSEMILRGLGQGKAFGYGLLVLPEIMSCDH
jgi:CRISPR-associated protein Cas6/Cse3/CasE subtype I-E